MYIQAGGDETLLDDSVRFGELAKKAGGIAKWKFFRDAARVPLYGRRGPRGRRGYYQNSEMG